MASSEFTRNLAFVNDINTIRKGHDLTELRGDQQHSVTFRALLKQFVMDKLDCTDINTAGRFRSNEKWAILFDFSGHDQLLDVAARQLTRLLA